MKTLLLISAVAFATFSFNTFAQNAVAPGINSSTESAELIPSDQGARARPDPVRVQAIHEQIRYWAQKELVPSLKEWKSQLDGVMTNADLSAVNLMRQRATELRKQRMPLMKSIREAWKGTDEVKLNDLRAQMKTIENQQRELFTELKPFVEKYNSTLKKIGDDARPKVKSWMESLKIRLREFTGSDSSYRPEHFSPEILNWGFGMMWAHPGAMPARIAAQFMLWDGDDIPVLSESLPFQTAPTINKIKTDHSFTLSQNVPNPVNASSTTFTFSLMQYDHVKMTLIDAKGTEVAVITDADYTAGEHYVEFPIPPIGNGAYIYRMVCSQGTLSNTMTILR
jgi:hypothetical protein